MTSRPGAPGNREIYIDAFRGLMALVMVQGHVCDLLLSPAVRATPLYQFQMLFHGSTAPGFLFASGFVAGLPRAPLSTRAAIRRGRRLLFVLATGYWLHLPYFSFWKTLTAGPREQAAFLACHALQLIAVTQLLVLVLQALFGRAWTALAGVLAATVVAGGPALWASQVSARLPAALAPFLDERTGSTFPVFPYAAFVLAGTVAGFAVGRQPEATRRRRAVTAGLLLVALGMLTARLTAAGLDFWKISPGYVLLRLGGLLLLLRLSDAAAARSWPGVRALALLGRETLLVYVGHLLILFGGVFGASPLLALSGRLGFLGALALLALLLPVLFALAWAWNRAKASAPRDAQLVLAFGASWFLFAFLARPW